MVYVLLLSLVTLVDTTEMH